MAIKQYKVLSRDGINIGEDHYDRDTLIILTDAQAKYLLYAGQIGSVHASSDPIEAPNPVPVTETNASVTITTGGVKRSVTVAEFINLFPSVMGLQGRPGEPGEPGPTGEQGERGEPGQQGRQGDPGPMGQAGPAGPDGPAGRQGEAGPRGTAGPAGPASWGVPTTWGAGIAYQAEAPASTVRQGGAAYLCVKTHISNDFASDFTAGRWVLIVARGDQGLKGDTGNTGATGPVNTLSIDTVTTGAPGSAASATITGAAPNQKLSLVIPRGDVGSAAGAVAKTGDTMTGQLLMNGGDIKVSKSYPSIQFVNANGKFRGWQFLDGSNGVQWVDYNTGIPELIISDGGAVNTRQVGDLKTYIDTKLAKTGGGISGSLNIGYADPVLALKNAKGDGGTWDGYVWNVLNYSQDGRLYFQNYDKNGQNGTSAFIVDRNGVITTAQLGDLKGYIDWGVRANVAQTFTGQQKLQAKKNLSLEIGRRYTSAGSYVITAADLGALVYCENTVGTLTVPLASQYTDGDYFWIYCRAAVMTVQATAGDPYTFGFGDYNRPSFVMRSGDRCKISLGADAWDVTSYTTAHDKALMVDRGQTFSDAEKTQLYANADIALPHGQCRLEYAAPTQIKLLTFNGNKIFINGNYRTIPASGVTMSNAGLAANTLYYIYAYMNGGVLSLLGSQSTPVTDPTYGNRTATSNPNAVLVGMVYMNSSAQFQYDGNVRWVASWFNRRVVTTGGGLVTNGGQSNSNTFIPVGVVFYTLSWGDQPVRAYSMGFAYGGAGGAQSRTAIYLNGGQWGISPLYTSYAATAYSALPCHISGYIGEGMHSFTVYILGNGGGTSVVADLNIEAMI